MNKEFIPYEQALELKELGFDEPCFGWYSNMEGNVFRQGYCETYLGIENCTKAPLYQQAFRWFREIKEVEYQITYAGAKGRYNAFVEDYFYDNNGDLKEFTYEEAELACLKKLIEIVKGKQL